MSWNSMNMRNHVCGFAVAAQRRGAALRAAKGRWEWSAAQMFKNDIAAGRFTGTEIEWKTRENRKRVSDRAGCEPFTEKQFKKMKWANDVSDRAVRSKAFAVGQSVDVLDVVRHYNRDWIGKRCKIVAIDKSDGFIQVETSFDRAISNFNRSGCDWWDEQTDRAFVATLAVLKQCWLAPESLALVA